MDYTIEEPSNSIGFDSFVDKYKKCQVCGEKLLPQSIYSYHGFCWKCITPDNLSCQSPGKTLSKLVYNHISGENRKSLVIPQTAKLYKEVHFDTGDFIEQYVYSKPILKNAQSSSFVFSRPGDKKLKSEKVKKTSAEVSEYRESQRKKLLDSPDLVRKKTNRLKKEIRRLINTNCFLENKPFCSFFTATYEDNEQDEYKAREDFNLFIKRLQYEFPRHYDWSKKRELSFEDYLWKIERQERGACHFHVIFFNCPYLHFSVFHRIWGKGTIDIHQIKKVHRVGSYVCKYITNDEKNQKDNPIVGKLWSRSEDLIAYIRREYSNYTTFLSKYDCLFQQPYSIEETGTEVIFSLYQKPSG